MPNSFFSPTAKITGGALFVSFNSKEGSIYYKMLKQIADNADKKGNFDGKNPLNVKLTQDEAADIIRAVKEKGEAKFYHTFKETKTVGNFRYYEIDKGAEGKKTGFGLSVKKTEGDQSFEVKIGFNPASAERLKLFLKNALVHIFDAEYSQDLKEAKEYADKKGSKPTAAKEEYIPKEAEKKPEPPPEEDDFGL
jgi:hypothetical protein